jgi:hypothetical protein
VHDGTWGVVPGVFESASSSPGWTLLLSGLTAVAPPAADALPLLVNLAAGIWLVWTFCANQRLIAPADRSWSTVLVGLVLGPVVLYVPALALLGMEHTLQCALVLYAFVRFERLQGRALTVRALLPLLVALALAGLVRFETGFVAVGFAVAFLVGTLTRFTDPATGAPWRPAMAARAGVLAIGAGVLGAVGTGLVNWSFGRAFLPNSIVSKSIVDEDLSPVGLLISPLDLVASLQRDPLVLAGVLLAASTLVWAWSGGPRRPAAPAAAYLVAALLHARLADFGWYERYQAYLVVLAAYLAFQVLADVVPAHLRAAANVSLVLTLSVLSITRIDLTLSAPRASSNTYRQRYQLGRFLERAYDGQPVATSELGYTSLYHDGPIVDVLGLGSHDVLDVIEGPGMDRARLARLLEDRRVPVLAVIGEYPIRPEGWARVGVWLLDERLVPGPHGRVLEFWAPPGRVEYLRRALGRFEARLPDRVVVVSPEPDAEV